VRKARREFVEALNHLIEAFVDLVQSLLFVGRVDAVIERIKVICRLQQLGR